MQRRQYLAAAVSTMAFGLAGCSGGTGSNNTSGNGSTPTSGNGATPTGTATPTEATTTAKEGTTTEGETATETATETDTQAQTATDTETATGTTTASGQAAFGPRTFSGSGTSTSEELDLAAGPVTAEFSHDGDGNFIVTLVTLEGKSYQDVSLTNLIGQVQGSQVATVRTAGAHKLNIDASGGWEITLAQPTNPQSKSLPVDASGDGSSYIGPFEFSGPTTFNGSHEGDGNFIVTPVPVDPSSMMLSTSVFNKIGQFDGSTTARIDGLAYLNVLANGAWTLSTQG
jgi:hypothetical protein